MSIHTQCLQRVRWPRSANTRCRHINFRSYGASHAAEGQRDWFEKLRAEMLGRPTHITRDYVNTDTHHKLQDTLKPFMPPGWSRRRIERGAAIVPLGHHLVWFNSFLPEDQLLPDGTDPLQSPGEPWVRRMWAGGEVEARKNVYFDHDNGFIIDQHMICSERITDVQKKGSDVKLFVTIERRYARLDSLLKALATRSWKQTPLDAQALFRQQIAAGEEWGDAILKEERTLVFLKEKTPVEQEAIAAGSLLPVKYLEISPGEPVFSHTLTPTRALLFRYSALTFNAHLIHLDRDYARNVEGHRNMLVHGPLSLTFMLQVFWYWIKREFGNKYVILSLKYQNLAPLYCDEEMRICIRESKTFDQRASYVVWIEGPTGGVAVKGKVLVIERVHTPNAIKPSADSQAQREPAPTNIRKVRTDGPITEAASSANTDVEGTKDQSINNSTTPIIREDSVASASPPVRMIKQPVLRKIAQLEHRGKKSPPHR
ncbi:hypothetical protein JI435_089920, partial [Parastagonospora nodorum SN15]